MQFKSIRNHAVNKFLRNKHGNTLQEFVHNSPTAVLRNMMGYRTFTYDHGFLVFEKWVQKYHIPMFAEILREYYKKETYENTPLDAIKEQWQNLDFGAIGGTMGDVVTALNAGLSPYATASLDANGALKFSSGSGLDTYSINVISDSTDRAGTGTSGRSEASGGTITLSAWHVPSEKRRKRRCGGVFPAGCQPIFQTDISAQKGAKATGQDRTSRTESGKFAACRY